MRIIAGSAGGRRLEVPPKGVRPTMDRVKGAIFSSLGEIVAGARVLDLFAGAGGLGIEALSRGARSAVFIETNHLAARVIERNLAALKFSGEVHRQDVFDFLYRQNRPGGSANQLPCFELVFADPPYRAAADGESFSRLLLRNENLPSLLAPTGVFVLEKSPAESLEDAAPWVVSRAKRYGATEVIFFSHQQNEQRVSGAV
ncbi:MAG: 16S rRNA (guanine(966)-N(2))-methyltransferase RsmD [Verrucomicrobiota bacterium]